MDDLTGKVAVVTGAASGIGRALAERFSAQGMSVVLADIEQTALDTAVKELSEQGARVHGVRADVADEGSVADLAREVLGTFGAVHVVCNNAGVSGFLRSTWDTPAWAWEWVLGVNLWGVIHGIRAFLPALLDQDEGHIVNTASVGGFRSPPFFAPYAASKHAVVGLSMALFHELALRGSAVGVTLLCPGPVRTNIMDSARNWPARLGNAPAHSAEPAAEALLQGARATIARGLEPSVLAEAVVDAVRARRFLVTDHEHAEPALRSLLGLLKGEDPALPSIV
jgi:NAD(P)-dependent dehydrogenase (short-subunit alcohol dehydrogenase family)